MRRPADRPEPPTAGPLPWPHKVLLAAARALGRAYPRSFRARFGRSMDDDWHALARAEAGGGVGGAARLARRIVREATASLPREWTRVVRTGGGGAPGAGTGHDVRAALRSLRRAPGFTLLAGSVLSLGLAGNLAVFALIDAYLLSPLPFPESDRLHAVSQVVPVDWTEGEEVFEHRISWDLDAFTLTGPGGAELVRGAWVAPGFFEAFGIEPALGRAFSPDEAGEGGASVAVIGHGLWQARFGGDPDVIGRTITTFASDRPDDSETFTIVGVLPADFWFFNGYTEMLAPLRADNPVYMARLRSDVSVERAEAWMTEMARARMDQVPADFRFELIPLRDRLVTNVRPTLLVLQAAVLLVLLVALGNVAVLLLVRGSTRAKELALRRALGAGRGRLARQLVVEGVVLTGTSALLGLAGAWAALGWGGAALERRMGVPVPGGADALGVDTSVVALAVGLALAIGVLFGVTPLLAGGGGSLRGALAEGGRSTTRRRGLRSVLVAAELALSLALLISAGLAVRSARAVAALDLGFDPERLVKAEVNLRMRSWPEGRARAEFFDRMVAGARAIPGVESAAATLRVPLTWNHFGGPVEAEGRPIRDPGSAALASTQVVGAGYLEAMDIGLEDGRDFEGGDVDGAEPVVIVSESLARRLWPGERALGRRLRELPPPGAEAHGDAEPGAWRTVVGVAGDVRLSQSGPDPHEAYVPYTQVTPTSMSVVIRAQPGAGSPIPALREVVAGLDPTVAVTSVVSLEDATLEARAPARFLAAVLGGFSAFAAALAVLGLYGVVAYAASASRRDVAVRKALGATSASVELLFLGRGAVTVAAGVALGLPAGAALARLLASRLHGVSPTDPAVYAGTAAALASAALLATWLPARRAARGEPVAVLREE